uniref:C-type lectin domain-containing protein n=1 Tax=Heterorhabditis bacteriophora TaxID=37862 RepID=A0A1I7WK81_HETBA
MTTVGTVSFAKCPLSSACLIRCRVVIQSQVFCRGFCSFNPYSEYLSAIIVERKQAGYAQVFRRNTAITELRLTNSHRDNGELVVEIASISSTYLWEGVLHKSSSAKVAVLLECHGTWNFLQDEVYWNFTNDTSSDKKTTFKCIDLEKTRGTCMSTFVTVDENGSCVEVREILMGVPTT